MERTTFPQLLYICRVTLFCKQVNIVSFGLYDTCNYLKRPVWLCLLHITKRGYIKEINEIFKVDVVKRGNMCVDSERIAIDTIYTFNSIISNCLQMAYP